MSGGSLSCRRRGRSVLLAAACILACGTSLVEADEPIRCSGWAGGAERDVPAASLNDGYCDCPFDGKDEPATGACAGSMDGGWAGIPSSVSGPAVVVPNGQFQCPQQKSIVLPLSRINDGICDCCDGADEPSGSCPDICEEFLAEERAAHAKIEADFAAGSKKRKEDMDEFAVMLKETVAEIEKVTKTELPRLEEEASSLEKAVNDARLKYTAKRFEATKQIVDSLFYIGEEASLYELRSFIISACQLSGEISDSNNSVRTIRNRRTCLPLRLAGLDLGFLWEDEDLSEFTASFRRLQDGDNDLLMEIADLLVKNSADGGKLSIGKDDNDVSHQRHRDRYRHRDDNNEEPDDYDGHGLDDDEYPYEADDDYYHDMSRENEEESDHDHDVEEETGAAVAEHSEESKSEAANEKKFPKEVREKAVRNSVRSTPISTLRAQFKLKANNLKDTMDAIQNEAENSEAERNEDDEADENAEAGTQQNVDPMAIQMARGTLDRRLKHLDRGEEFATSAKVLLDAFEEAGNDNTEGVKRDMIYLAIFTVYHGQLAAGDVAELFYMLMPEFQPNSGEAKETCSSRYAAMCPPRAVTRQASSLPPTLLVSAAEARCEERSSAPAVCSGEMDGAEDMDIPSSVPDGYAGYFIPQLRDGADPLIATFSPLEPLISIRDELSELEVKKEERDTELAGMRSNLRNLEDKIGGRDEPKYGADGELYGLRDSCHSVESGKYEYEVCIFGKATQRDKGDKGGGTNLGRWAGMKRDEETGQRILTWDQGTKCWNGPNRSATVFVTCGAETKLLTADEPRTCEYVFTMASHIACDAEFREGKGIR